MCKIVAIMMYLVSLFFGIGAMAFEPLPMVGEPARGPYLGIPFNARNEPPLRDPNQVTKDLVAPYIQNKSYRIDATPRGYVMQRGGKQYEIDRTPSGYTVTER